jgi:hypothetical protein
MEDSQILKNGAIKKMGSDYCGSCRRVTPHIKDDGVMLCKRCGKQEKRKGINITKFSTGGFN